MIRKEANYNLENIALFKQQMLIWANQFNICCFLDSLQYNNNHHSVDCLLAVQPISFIHTATASLAAISKYIQTTHDWLFGHFSYDFKEELLNLAPSKHKSMIGFPHAYWFQPDVVVQLKGKKVFICSISQNPAAIFEAIASTVVEPIQTTPTPKVQLQPKMSKADYLASLAAIQQHIQKGDCYEMNFCQEFNASGVVIDPVAVYRKLLDISPNPFACYYKLENSYLLCASPERFLKKTGKQLISQPIKGTQKRDPHPIADQALQQQLQHSVKDRSENVMIVDLVRNDLSKICVPGSVQVEELFGVYSFPQVHQMISTIVGTLQDNKDVLDIIAATFPMGSMTGAPKKKVMELTEQYEHSARGIYSGTVGYFTPNKDFDLNVVIRSIMYNAVHQHISYQVGGGITIYSDPLKEYEECLLKAAAIRQVLQ